MRVLCNDKASCDRHRLLLPNDERTLDAGISELLRDEHSSRGDRIVYSIGLVALFPPLAWVV